MNLHLNRRHLLSTAMAASALLLLGSARAAVGGVAGEAASLPYRVIDLDWRDEQRQRDVPARLYLPRLASAEQPVPLVVFSHGIGGSRMGYSYLGRHWASQGFASLHLQHVGSDRKVWTGGSPFTVVGRLRDAAQDLEAIARTQDLRFALDQVLGSPMGPVLDAQRIVAAGHSYGANTTLLVAGAQVERQGKLLDLVDARLRAAIVISAPPFYGEGSPSRILGAVHIPSLHITATDDVIRIPGYFSAADDRIAIFDSIGSSARKLLAVFTGGSHSIFTDRQGAGGAELNALVKAATCELTTAFIRSTVRGDDTGLLGWSERHAGILTRFVGPR